MNPYKCPNCGEPLVLKKGRYGRFMACPNYPDCRYTRAIWTYQASGEKPYCEKCKGEGMLPLIKDGKTIPNAFVYCECHEEEENRPPTPDDFDFPMSYDFYRSLCQHHGWSEPADIEQPASNVQVGIANLQPPQVIYRCLVMPAKKQKSKY